MAENTVKTAEVSLDGPSIQLSQPAVADSDDEDSYF